MTTPMLRSTHMASMRCKLPVLQPSAGEKSPKRARVSPEQGISIEAVASGKAKGKDTVEVDLVCEKSLEDLSNEQVLSSCRLRAYCPETGRDISEHTLCDRLRNRRFCCDKDPRGTKIFAIHSVCMQQMLCRHDESSDDASSGEYNYLCLQFFPQQVVLGMPLALADDEITGEEACKGVELEESADRRVDPQDVLRIEIDDFGSHESFATASLCDNKVTTNHRATFIAIPTCNYDFQLLFFPNPEEDKFVDTRGLDLLTRDLWNEKMIDALYKPHLELRPHKQRTKHGVFRGIFQEEEVDQSRGTTPSEYLYCDQYFNTGRGLQDRRAEMFVTDRPIKVWISQRTLSAAEANAPFENEQQQADLRARLQAANKFYRTVELGWPAVFRGIIETGFSPEEVLALNMLKPEDDQSLRSDRRGFQNRVMDLY
ncbi:unnamed protein product [Amoebophrya sp. A25]|nr:unnamed protein product [Amoebophrya sp. A25]|eukprot:GSA25T00025641001.1